MSDAIRREGTPRTGCHRNGCGRGSGFVRIRSVARPLRLARGGDSGGNPKRGGRLEDSLGGSRIDFWSLSDRGNNAGDLPARVSPAGDGGSGGRNPSFSPCGMVPGRCLGSGSGRDNFCRGRIGALRGATSRLGAWFRFPGAGVAGAARDSLRIGHDLRADRGFDRTSGGGASCRNRRGLESDCLSDSLPSRHP